MQRGQVGSHGRWSSAGARTEVVGSIGSRHVSMGSRFFGFGLDFGVGQAGNHWTGSFEGACGPRFLV